MSQVERWERRAEVPLLLFALAFLIAYAWPVVDQNVNPDLAAVLHAATWTVWAAFGVDLVIRLYLAEDRLHYARRHWYDVALLLLPLLRPLRLLRLLAIARIFNRITTSSLVGRVGFHVLGTAMMAAILAAIAMLDVEQDAADANITTLGDAMWWSATTVTTVGYGDRYPVTTAGRLIAVALMVVGIATVGAIIATVTGWVVAQVEHDKGGVGPRGHGFGD